LASKVEKYDIFWIEEPVAPDDLRGSQLVAQSTSIPVATGEAEYTKYGFRDLMENRSAAILQPDALIMGGITEFMKVAAMAQANDFHISNHGPHHIHAHLLAAIPNGLIIEEYFTSEAQPIDGGIFLDQMSIVDGYISPPDRPGLGMELNEEALAPYRIG
jgi:D-arabinonate dehydratase